MTKSQERKLNNAIFQLKRYYEHALGNGHIRHPLAWALYQTWFDEDIKSRKTDGKKYKSDMEVWNGMNGQVVMPKGTFEKIYNEAEEEDNDI